MPLLTNNMQFPYFSNWKKHMIPHGNTVYLKIFIILDFNVRLGFTISDNFEQEMGVPQGSILSVTLFRLKINSLADVL